MKSTTAHNLLWGIKRGLAFGAGFSALASLGRLVFGRIALARLGVDLPTVVASYVLAGIAGGAIVGLMRSKARSRAGAALTGFLVSIPFSLELVFATARQYPDFGIKEWSILTLFLGLTLGCGGGMILQEIFSD